MFDKLVTAKLELYKLLLDNPGHQLTPTEVEVMFQLSNDPDVQAVIERGAK